MDDLRAISNGIQSGPAVSDKSIQRNGYAAAVKTSVVQLEASSAVSQPASVPSLAQLKQAVANINNSLQSISQGVEFSIDESTAHTIIKVVDQQTKEVLRQVPTKEALEIAKALDRVQGMLIRQKA